MICLDLFLAVGSGIEFLIAWSIFAPIVAAAGVALYYRHRYKDAIKRQCHFERGLYETNTRI